jgi:histidinol-phosphate/aromatic aminotransferase/cobyric acid decarboxylase-like protein
MTVIRRATPSDLASADRLRHAVFAEEVGQYPTTESGSLPDAGDPSTIYLVAVESSGQEEEVVGVVALTPPPVARFRALKYFPGFLEGFLEGSQTEYPAEPPRESPAADRTFEIRGLAVRADRRGTGRVAAALCYAAIETASRMGAEGFVAMAIDSAQAMYLRAGFVFAERDAVAERDTGAVVTCGRTSYRLMVADAGAVLRSATILQRALASFEWRVEGPALGAEHGSSSEAGGSLACDVLDAWFPPSPAALAAIAAAPANKTPETGAWSLASAVERRRGLLPGSAVAGCGSSELIHALFRALRPGTVSLRDDTYSEYRYAAELYGASVVGPDADRFDAKVVVNPNNPTGETVSASALAAEAAARPDAWFVVDETYSDYAAGNRTSVERLHLPNVIVVKSMSKCWGLSGVRAGYLACNAPDLVARIRREQPPWTVSNAAAAAAEAALSCESEEHYRLAWLDTHRERSLLALELRRLGAKVRTAPANWVTLPEATRADVEAWKASGLRARKMYPAGARVTVLPRHRARILRTIVAPRGGGGGAGTVVGR